jgi:ribonuclease BN (tRNA processing enzyme)
MAQLIFLGTAAALPVADRDNTALAVVGHTPASGLLIDCGGNIWSALQRAAIGPDTIGDLLITHAHIDHIAGLPSLIESFRLGRRRAPLRIWSIPEALDIAKQIAEVFSYELTLDSWTYEISFHTVEDGQRLTLAGFPARVQRVDHSLPCAGLRLELPLGAVAYTSDTQPVDAVQSLGEGARMLITECTFLHRNVTYARRSKHSTALEAGQEAAVCGVEMLALVHLGVAEGWTADEARAEAEQAYKGTVLTPSDGESLEV